MNLWDWAIRAYALEEVERLCLDFQDLDGQCVSLLLWAAWAADSGRSIGPEDLDRAIGVAKVWEERALRPLRAVRRDLKQAAPGVEDRRREDVRAKVQEVELAAERLLLEALEARTPAQTGPRRDCAAALIEAALAWNGAAPERLVVLADAFPRD